MAYVNTQQASFVAIATLRVVDAIFNTINTTLAWNEARKTRKILNSLSNEQLEDIGLTRGDIV